MSYRHFAVLSAVFFLGAGASLAVARRADVEMVLKTDTSLSGEPVLVKTIARNLSGEHFAGERGRASYGWSHGFALYISRDDGPYYSVVGDEGFPPFACVGPPMHVDFWSDAYTIVGTIERGGQRHRVDVLVLSDPGQYRIKAVFKNPDGTVRLTSAPASLRVLSHGEIDSSTSEIPDVGTFKQMGLAFHGEFYRWQTVEGAVELAQTVLSKYPHSRLAHYAAYVQIASDNRPEISIEALRTESIPAARRFIGEYPDSWLLPDMYGKLFWSYLAYRNEEAAVEIGREALARFPDASILREVPTTRLLSPEARNRLVPPKRPYRYRWVVVVSLVAGLIALTTFWAATFLSR